MSCDFAVWNATARLTNVAAGRLYRALCDGDSSGVSPSPAIDAFYSEITSLHPERRDIPDAERDNWDLCPWSADIDRSPGHLVMTCVWSKAGYVDGLVRELARKHRLALYDPQAEEIVYSDEPARPFLVRLWRAIWDQEDRDPWYIYVIMGLLVILAAGLEYVELAGIAEGHADRFFVRVYELGGAPAALGVPALIGAALVFLGVRKRLANKING